MMLLPAVYILWAFFSVSVVEILRVLSAEFCELTQMF